MADPINRRISALPALADAPSVSLGASDVLPLDVTSGTTRRATLTQLATYLASSPVPAATFLGRNAINNGAMTIAQRGNGPWTADGTFGIDQHRQFNAGTTQTVTRQAFAPGAIPGVVENGAYLRSVVASAAGAGNFAILSQSVEDAGTFAGQTVTVSFYAKADSARPIAIELNQVFGTGGAPSATVTAIGVTKLNLTTAWARYSATVSIPTVAGKTFGSAGDSALRVNYFLDAGSTFNARTNTLGQQSGTFEFWGFQLEFGPNPTVFEHENIAVTFERCRRYFKRVGNLGWYKLCITTSTSNAWTTFIHSPPFRATPSVTVTGLSNGLLLPGIANYTPATAVQNDASATMTAMQYTSAALFPVAGTVLFTYFMQHDFTAEI